MWENHQLWDNLFLYLVIYIFYTDRPAHLKPYFLETDIANPMNIVSKTVSDLLESVVPFLNINFFFN